MDRFSGQVQNTGAKQYWPAAHGDTDPLLNRHLDVTDANTTVQLRDQERHKCHCSWTYTYTHSLLFLPLLFFTQHNVMLIIIATLASVYMQSQRQAPIFYTYFHTKINVVHWKLLDCTVNQLLLVSRTIIKLL